MQPKYRVEGIWVDRDTAIKFVEFVRSKGKDVTLEDYAYKSIKQ